MFSFWSRKGNKSPGRASNLPSQPSQQSQDVELPRTSPRIAHLPHVPAQEDHPHPIPTEVASGSGLAAASNPHDAAVAEVHAKLLQAEQLASTAHPPRLTDPLTDAASPPKNPPEPFFDPATGAQRGLFEPFASGTPGDSEQHHDVVWTHLARIREIQSEIAKMHVHMEGIGDETGSIDVEVDNDIDVDTVPTQEEEEAARMAREFDKLPGRFKGRSDNIDAMMTKLHELSRAVTSFHALQPPPLSFDLAPTSRQNTHSDTSTSAGDPITGRTRAGFPPPVMFGPKIDPDQHDSPITTHVPMETSPET